MNILIAGGRNSLMDDIINKCRKEDHQIYILTGSSIKGKSYGRKVFETYNFSYDCDCLNEIYESINPDVILFLGAYDPNFSWEEPRRESVRYYACLSNILIAYAQRGKGRFIYLSSHKALENGEEWYWEEVDKYQSLAWRQGEEMCESYRRRRNLDIVTLHLENLYGVPESMTETDSLCVKLCLEAVRDHRITIRNRDEFSILYQADGVEAIYRVIDCESHLESVYDVSANRIVTELGLAHIIRLQLGKEVEIIDLSQTKGNWRVVPNDKFNKEFHFNSIHSVEDTVKAVLAKIQKHSKIFQLAAVKGRLNDKFSGRMLELGRELIPYMENLVCFIPFFMLNNRAVGSQYFANLDFYLLYVLLFAIVHGQFQAIFSSVLAVAGYLFRQMYNRTGFDVMLDYNTYVWIAQLFILGLVVGYLRDQRRVIRQERDEEVAFLKRQLDDIKEINISNVRMKQIMETQILNQNDSVGTIYEITSELDKYAPEEVIFYAVEVLDKLMDSRDVAIYNISGSYARLFTFTSDTARTLGNSFRLEDLGEVYQSLSERRVYINKKMNSSYPLMANAVYGQEKMELIIMIWGISWERMTLNQANRLTIISYLIQNALMRANRYLEALESQRYVEGTRILDAEAFQSLMQAYIMARDKGLAECSTLQVKSLPGEQEEVAERLRSKLRFTDYLGRLEDGNLYVLLPNTSQVSAETVIQKLQENGIESYVWHETLE